MPGKKKKFINKNDAVTFHLVHRSQRDPLQADDDAPQHVLLDTNLASQEKRHNELRKYGVFYTDDYDYMQHLRDANDLQQVALDEAMASDKGSRITLPSSVFGSSMETNVGLLNKAVIPKGPQPDWDPDIVAALDDDFDFDDPMNQLDDDFMQLANPKGVEKGDDDDGDIASDEADMSDDEDDIGSDCGNFSEQSFSEEETRSRFTAYSMTSSVMRRSDGLTLLDDRFEHLYQQYDDDEIGALDQDDIDGVVQQKSAVLSSVMDEFEKQQKVTTLKDIIQKGTNVAVVSSDESDSDIELMEKVTVDDNKRQWDCESIISTYSNLYNHPKRIDEPRKPRQVSVRSEPPPSPLQPCDQRERMKPTSTLRPKDETSEEKRQRKKAVKEEKKLRRVEKKENKVMYKTEEMRQSKEMMNIRNNIQGLKVT